MSNPTWEHPTVTSNGVTIPHNDKPWSLRTNSHRGISGEAWGWIDGIDGSLEWSNADNTFTEADAQSAIDQHNGWLQAQVPLEVALIHAHKTLEAFTKDREKCEAQLERALESETIAQAHVDELLARRETQHHAAIAQAFLEAADELDRRFGREGNSQSRALRARAIDYTQKAQS